MFLSSGPCQCTLMVNKLLTGLYLHKVDMIFVCVKQQIEPSLKSNCPEHIPSPALLPGEALILKQHRIMCVDATEEPMIGVLYITNYRVIFSGNLLSVSRMLELIILKTVKSLLIYLNP